MKALLQIQLLIALACLVLVSGCDTITGVNRSASVHALPDLQGVKARMESYPEIDEVKYSESEGGRPITPTGLKQAERVYYLSYSGGKKVRGRLMFVENYKGEISYSQTLCMMNGKIRHDLIDTTWPVMKKIESDLESLFGLPEIQNNVRVIFVGVKNPDRAVPD